MNFKKDTGLQPTLRIQLDQDASTHWFRPGDKICGYLEVDTLGPPLPPITLAGIYLIGRSKTKVNEARGQTGTHDYRDRIDLFRRDRDLRGSRDETRHRDDPIQRFPFTLRFPDATDPHPEDKVKHLFNRAIPNPLPPTLPRVEHYGYRQKGYGYISYRLTAFLQAHDSSQLPSSVDPPLDLEAIAEVNLNPLVRENLNEINPEWDPRPATAPLRTVFETFTRSSSALLPATNSSSSSSRPSTLRETLHDKLSFHTPKAVFAIYLTLPERFALNLPLPPCTLRLEYDGKKSTCTSPPDVEIQHLSWGLLSLTQCSAPGTLHLIKTPVPFTEQADVFLPMNWGQEIDLAAMCGLQACAEGSLVPTFESFSVIRVYEWRTEVGVLCGGKVFKAEFKMDVRVLPPVQGLGG
ncbi:MAG: hypothetical protein M1833_000258 [Piccolia ochrophora]|nr:MAG: hypothetical protein M1833_000258 [Piccolia ochrophora]